VSEPAPGTGEIYYCAWNWGNEVAWDAVRREVTWLGSNHYDVAESTDPWFPQSGKHYRYAAATNTWSAQADPFNTGSPTSGNGVAGSWKTGHTYDENAFDSLRRILWKIDPGSDQIRGINVDDGSYWGRLYIHTEAIGYGRVLIYNPTLDALVLAAPNNDDSPTEGNVWVRQTSGGVPYTEQTWTHIGACPDLTAWHMLGFYHEGAGECIFGGGTNSGTNCYAWY
jgi:hypothetical protein